MTISYVLSLVLICEVAYLIELVRGLGANPSLSESVEMEKPKFRRSVPFAKGGKRKPKANDDGAAVIREKEDEGTNRL